MNTENYLQKKLYRAGLTAGGVMFGISFLEPVLAAVSPFLPLIAAVLTGLISGLVVKGIFNLAVNTRLNQSYRYSANDSASGGSAASRGQQTRKPKQHAGQEPPPPDPKVMYRKILGLGERYTLDELKAAYRDCAAKFHPDRYVNASERERRRAEEMMKNINEAYHALL
ncbi:MAG: J domain-containing protein [Treponema sp.]|jgi:hypothetical protein|nr:J domain-containing protein [Treponema sp.]